MKNSATAPILQPAEYNNEKSVNISNAWQIFTCICVIISIVILILYLVNM